MEVKPLALNGLLEIRPSIFRDDRGYFFEAFNINSFRNAGITTEFVQDNQSFSRKGTIRGLHFQNPPHAQGKLVWVSSGKVLDVVVDIRKNSPTYGKHIMVELSAENKLMLWIPPGFAHGFLSLEDQTIFLYKCTSTYHKESESGIIWNDPELNIEWGINNPIVSDKDLELRSFSNIESRF